MYVGACGAREVPVIIGPRKTDPWYSVCFIMGPFMYVGARVGSCNYLRQST